MLNAGKNNREFDLRWIMLVASSFQFDVLGWLERFKVASVSDAQSHVLVDAFRETMDKVAGVKDATVAIENKTANLEQKISAERELSKEKRKELATKGDLRSEIEHLRADLEIKIEKVRADLETKIEKVRVELLAKMSEYKTDVIKWMVGGFIAQTALLFAAMRLK
jgi:vacuolar-type H+-ATPase subunit I/STV1